MRIVRAAIVGLGMCLCATVPGMAQEKPPEGKINYEDHVRPIFRNRCLTCHNQDQAKGDLALDSYASTMKGGSSGEIVSAGDVESSRLYALVSHKESPKMPPNQDRIPDAELNLIKQWILDGLLENSGSKAKPVKKPAFDLTVSAGGKRPEGPPPMPGPLSKGGVVHSARPGAVTALACSPWAPLAAIASPKQVLLYHTDTAELVGVLPFPEGIPYVLRFSRSGTLLLAGGGRPGLMGKVVVYDIKTGKRAFEVGDELDVVLAADINEDHTLIALGGPRKSVKIYATADGSLLHEIKKHTDWVTALEFSPDGVLLATGDRNGGLFVWESETAREFHNLRAHTKAISSVSWRLDSNILASASEDTTVRLWELENGGNVKGWGAHGNGTTRVMFTHDGRLVTAGRDNLVKCWDQNGAQQKAFESFADIALVAAFTHDGNRVLGGDWTGLVRMWEYADGKRVAELSTNPPTLAMIAHELARQAELAEAEANKHAAEQVMLQKTVEEKVAELKAATDAAAVQQAAAARAEEEKTAAAKAAEEAAKATAIAQTTADAAKQAAEKLTAERMALEKLLAEKMAAEKDALNKAAAAKTEYEKLAAAKTAAEQALAAKDTAAKVAAAKLAAAEEAAAKAAAAKAAAEKAAAEKAATAKAAAERGGGSKAAGEKTPLAAHDAVGGVFVPLAESQRAALRQAAAAGITRSSLPPRHSTPRRPWPPCSTSPQAASWQRPPIKSRVLQTCRTYPYPTPLVQCGSHCPKGGRRMPCIRPSRQPISRLSRLSHRLALGAMFLWACLLLVQAARGGDVPTELDGLPLLLHETFEQGADRWEPTDFKAWKLEKSGDNTVFSQFVKNSNYHPPHRSPLNIALLKDLVVSDFILLARVKSTIPDYGHRDACLFFGHQDAKHFYYVHLGKQTDDHANQVFIVNDAPRTKISLKTTAGTPWDDAWHEVKIVRRAGEGTIEVYFDDMQSPAMTAKDKTFPNGRVGIGSFDDTTQWDDVRLYGKRLQK